MKKTTNCTNKSKKKHYTYEEPYYVIDTDYGFICYNVEKLYRKGGKVQYSLHTDKCWKEYDTWYKHNYDDKKEDWKPCYKAKYVTPTYPILKRKSRESVERLIENIKNGTIKNPGRFPNPQIIEITTSFKEYVEKKHSVGIAYDVNYNIWEW